MVYFCDPVLGDNGKLYVPEALVDLYRSQVLPIATVLTPNQFECELLSGVKISTAEDAHKACAKVCMNE
jgi:pyridoxine kinase